MKKLAFRQLVAFVAVAVLGILANRAHAGATAALYGDGVQVMFSSESDAYQASDPAGLTPFTPALGFGPYPLAPLSNLPAPPVASIYPPPGNPLPDVSTFNDGYPAGSQTAGDAIIFANTNLSPNFTSDEGIGIPFFRLHQDAGAAGYAYDQLNFGSNYYVTFNSGLAGSTPNQPIFIQGSVLGAAGAYAQLDGEVNYSWTPLSGIPGTTTFTVGTTVPLGSLTWNWLQLGGGAFSTPLFSSGSLAATPAGDGILSLDGYMWLAGDPSDITVTPEPSTLVLLGVGVVSLLAFAWRKRRQAA